MEAWKAVDAELRDCYDPAIRYAVGQVTSSPQAGGLIVHTDPTRATNRVSRDVWPLRLLKVAVGEADVLSAHDSEVYCRRLEVVSEEPLARAFGPSGEAVLELLDELARVPWFAHAGRAERREEAGEFVARVLRGVGLPEARLSWRGAADLPGIVASPEYWQSPLWAEAERGQARLRQVAAGAGLQHALLSASDAAADAVKDPSYDGADAAFASLGEAIVRMASGGAIYAASLACAWAALAHEEAFRENPLRPLLRIFATGHWLLGVFDGEAVLL